LGWGIYWEGFVLTWSSVKSATTFSQKSGVGFELLLTTAPGHICSAFVAHIGIGNKVNLIELCLALPLAIFLLFFLPLAQLFVLLLLLYILLFCCLRFIKTKWKINFVCTLKRKAKRKSQLERV